jgi:hypothetical protein
VLTSVRISVKPRVPVASNRRLGLSMVSYLPRTSRKGRKASLLRRRESWLTRCEIAVFSKLALNLTIQWCQDLSFVSISSEISANISQNSGHFVFNRPPLLVKLIDSDVPKKSSYRSQGINEGVDDPSCPLMVNSVITDNPKRHAGASPRRIQPCAHQLRCTPKWPWIPLFSGFIDAQVTNRTASLL